MIISVVNTKGGVTKTTTSMYLASEMKRRYPERSVLVADLDKQGTATEWADLAEDNGQPLPFKVDVSNTKRIARLAEQMGPDDFLVIDTPPGDASVIQAAVDISDFVIIPTRPSGADTARVWETLKALGPNKLYAVLVVFARLGTNLLRDTLATFEAEDISRFDTIVPLREKQAKEYGLLPTPDGTYADVLKEMMDAMAAMEVPA